MPPIPPTWRLKLVTLALLLGVAACSKPASNAASAAPTAATGSAVPAEQSGDRHVRLSTDDVARMGIVTTVAAATQYVPETAGYAVVLSHDAIAQAAAELETAEAQVKQSHAALARMDQLAGTAGADTAEAHEAAQRQASTDAIAVALAQRKLSALVGQHAPWEQGSQSVLRDVATGHIRIVRATFALGTLQQPPRRLRLARLDAPLVQAQLYSRTIWAGPADTSMPGRSFLALLPDAAVEEGERLSAWAPSEAAAALSGTWLPGSAAVAEGGRYWCYVQHEDGSFERTPLDINHPLRDGYFVSDPKAGERVVTVGAGLLLAKELNPDTEAAD